MINPAAELFHRLHDEILPFGTIDLTPVMDDTAGRMISVEAIAEPPSITHRVHNTRRAPEETKVWARYELAGAAEESVVMLGGLERYLDDEVISRDEQPPLTGVQVTGMLVKLAMAVTKAKQHRRDTALQGQVTPQPKELASSA
jgi:hypothetical protein